MAKVRNPICSFYFILFFFLKKGLSKGRCRKASHQQAQIWQGVRAGPQPGTAVLQLLHCAGREVGKGATVLLRGDGAHTPPSLGQHVDHPAPQWPGISLLASETHSLQLLSLLSLPAPVQMQCRTLSMPRHSHTQKKHRPVITCVLDAPVPTPIRKLSKEDTLDASLGRSYHIPAPDTAKQAALVGCS